MGALFSPPKPPKITMAPPPPPVPTVDQAARDEGWARLLRRRIGFRANTKTGVGGSFGNSITPSVATKTLLG